jgi:HTH-type transcriptional regulator, sugar sensing transcriptional regulator
MHAPNRDPNAGLSGDLQELGFTDYEARVYVALLLASPATAYEISKNNALPRPNVYGALESLERKGAVQRASSEPVRYIPVDPKELLDRISRTVHDRCASLQERLEHLKPAQQTEYVWNIAGGEDAHSKINELVSAATRHVWIKAHHLALEPHFAALQAAAGRGVSVLLVLFGDKAQVERWKSIRSAVVYAHEADGTVVGLGRDLVTLTADFEVALLANLNDGTGAFTRSSAVVNLADSMLRHEVYLAEVFGAFGKELEGRFGPALLSLRKAYLPAEQVLALEQHLSQQPPRGGR